MSRKNSVRRCIERGNALRDRGQVAAAISAYRHGLSASPNSPELHISLGNILLTAHGDLPLAAASYRRALSAQPEHREARIRLAHVLRLSADYAGAADTLRSLAADYPDDPFVSKEFGKLYFALHRLDAARESFREVLELRPNDADTHHWLANIEHLRGHADVAREHYRRALELKPLIRIPAANTPADFSVLFLFAPGSANTPHDTLTKAAAYESCFLLLVPGARYDVEALRGKARLVVNLISDVDQGREILQTAEILITRLGLPVVNDPRAVLQTDRESVADRLAGIPACRVPQVRRLDGASVAAAVGGLKWTFPLLVRVVGTHGGEAFEKVGDVAEIERFVAAHRQAWFYLTQYADYRSSDGYFRKYRFFFVDGAILPYHLAIHDTWKVHHATTGMADRPWMRSEEEAFLAAPESVFEPRHVAALQAIRAAIGLDFFGIDCAIDAEGLLVVFEVNATMLVHQSDERFAYKAPAVDRIKRAFDAMLRRRALGE